MYLAAFMDDHSRFLMSYALAHHQRSELVMEALQRGIAAYGAPREILTDQGRQYTAWRGETDFERELRREGIRHVKSRQIARSWKTLWDEFLSRTVFAEFADCDRRLGLYVQAYMHYTAALPVETLRDAVHRIELGSASGPKPGDRTPPAAPEQRNERAHEKAQRRIAAKPAGDESPEKNQVRPDRFERTTRGFEGWEPELTGPRREGCEMLVAGIDGALRFPRVPERRSNRGRLRASSWGSRTETRIRPSAVRERAGDTDERKKDGHDACARTTTIRSQSVLSASRTMRPSGSARFDGAIWPSTDR